MSSCTSAGRRHLMVAAGNGRVVSLGKTLRQFDRSDSSPRCDQARAYASFVACSLLAPNDDYFFGTEPPQRAQCGANASGAPNDDGETSGLAGHGVAVETACDRQPLPRGDLREENGVCVSMSGC